MKIISVVILILIIICNDGYCYNLNSNKVIDGIIMAESSGRSIPGKCGEYGIMQITKPVVIDYNKANGTKHSHIDMLNPDICRKIGTWRWTKEIPSILRRRKLQDTLYIRAMLYTCGTKSTIKYLKKGYTPKRVRIWLINVKKYLKTH